MSPTPRLPNGVSWGNYRVYVVLISRFDIPDDSTWNTLERVL